MIVYLKNETKESPSKSPQKNELPEPLEVKEVLKYLLKHAFSKASELPYDVNVNSTNIVSILFTASDSTPRVCNGLWIHDCFATLQIQCKD